MNRTTDLSLRRRRGLLWGILVVVVVWFTAHEVPGFDFVAWDDDYNILVNPHLGPPTAENIAWMFTDFSYMRRYIPFGWLGFSVAYAFSGLSPFAYHVGNLLLHATNALLLFLLIAWALRRWHPAPRESRIHPCAAAGALFWAVHPLRAETIGWASGLLYSLACAFALLSVLAYCRAQTANNPATSRAWRSTALLLYTVSLLTYPITIGLVAVFIAIDVLEWHRRVRLASEGGATRAEIPDAPALATAPRRTALPPLRPLAVRQLPFLFVALAVTAVTLFSRVTASSFWPPAPTLEEVTVIDRVMRAFYTIASYLGKTLWPANLTPLPPQLTSFTDFGLAAVLSFIAIIALTWLLWRVRSRRPALLILWACTLVLLAPMLGFTEKYYHASDRYSYVPAMTLGFALAAALVSLPRRAFQLAAAATVVGLTTFALLTSIQLRVWHDSTTLFAHCVESAADPRLRDNAFLRWANFHAFRGEASAATAVLDRAEQAGAAPAVQHEIEQNLVQAAEEVRLGTAPLVARIHEGMAVDLARAGRTREADEHFAAALSIAPQSATLHYNQALYAAASGEARKALHHLLAALADADGTISAQAQQQAWSLISQAFAHHDEPTLAARAQERAALVTDSHPGQSGRGTASLPSFISSEVAPSPSR